MSHPLEGTAHSADRQHHHELAKADVIVISAACAQMFQTLIDVRVFPLLAQVNLYCMHAIVPHDQRVTRAGGGGDA